MRGLFFTVGTAVITICCYVAMRFITGGDPEEQTKDLASSVVFRISALHGLILALVFAQEMVEYQQLKFESAVETNALADIYFDADRYGAEAKINVQEPVYKYVATVLDSEWRELGKTGRLSGEAWAQWDYAYNAILNLTPQTDRQESLRDHMLDRVHTIAEMRVKRESHASGSFNVMFWFAAVAGVVFIALAYYSYPPRPHNLLLLSMFGAFTGIVLFFIYSFANPYSPPGALNPSAHARLLEQIDRSRADEGSPVSSPGA